MVTTRWRWFALWALVVSLGAASVYLVVVAPNNATSRDGTLTHSEDGLTPTSPVTVAAEEPPLVGTWVVRRGGLEGFPMSIDRKGSFRLQIPGCDLNGTWDAAAPLLAMFVDGGGGHQCGRFWSEGEALNRVQTFRQVGTDLLLVSRRGDVVARLTPAGERSPIEPVQQIPSAGPDGHLGGLNAASMSPAFPRVVGLRWFPVSSDRVGHRWYDAHVQLRVNGSWKGSDGCNLFAGTWSAEPATGEFVATVQRHSTLVGCDFQDAWGPFIDAEYAALDRGQLVVFESDGGEIGRYESPIERVALDAA